MNKQEVLQSLKKSLQEDSLSEDVGLFHCLGHVWETYPKYEKEGNYYRCWLFEHNQDPSIRVLLGDGGNTHFDYVCEGTEEAMDAHLQQSC